MEFLLSIMILMSNAQTAKNTTYYEHYCDRFGDLINTQAYDGFWTWCRQNKECTEIDNKDALESCP